MIDSIVKKALTDAREKAFADFAEALRKALDSYGWKMEHSYTTVPTQGANLLYEAEKAIGNLNKTVEALDKALNA